MNQTAEIFVQQHAFYAKGQYEVIYRGHRLHATDTHTLVEMIGRVDPSKPAAVPDADEGKYCQSCTEDDKHHCSHINGNDGGPCECMPCNAVPDTPHVVAIQHDETGRMSMWNIADDLPKGWSAVPDVPPEAMYSCVRCGYVGREIGHGGCGYYAVLIDVPPREDSPRMAELKREAAALMAQIEETYGVPREPEERTCRCATPDAWRCMKAGTAVGGVIACSCPCHQYLREPEVQEL